MSNKLISFQEIINKLNNFWASNGCIILQPYDSMMGAGTLHHATAFAPCKQKWNVAYVQPVRRPADGRFANHPNRVQHFYQYQVLLKPAVDNLQEIFIESLKSIGIDSNKHDLSFIHDDWKSPTLGAFGLGWEFVCNGIEISQITYMTQMAGIACKPHIGELTYGLERITSILQGVEQFSDIIWSNNPKVYYGELFSDFENDYSNFNFKSANVDVLKKSFDIYESECKRLAKEGLFYVAYDYCLMAIHTFNILDAQGVLSGIEREKFISTTQLMSSICVKGLYKKSSGN